MEPNTPSTKSGTVHDRRVPPRGVLPRRIQAWIMAGLALVIVVVILLTGKPAPTSSPLSIEPPPAAPVSDERVRTFQRELDERQQPAGPPVAVDPTALLPVGEAGAAALPTRPQAEPSRESDSLFADNVAFTRRDRAMMDTIASVGVPSVPAVIGDTSAPIPSAAPAPAPPSAQPDSPLVQHAGRPDPQVPERDGVRTDPHRLAEGTVVETVLLNRLDGTFSGPVACLVTTPVYSQNRQHVLVPAGARFLGTAAPVEAWGDARLAVTFHRLVLPDGRSVTLNKLTGLNQIGETGLKERVDRHYLQVFAASMAVGAISGLAQWGTRSSYDQPFGDAARQSAGAGLAASTGRILDRYLNVLPTVTIREGHRIKVYVTADVTLPAYIGDQRLVAEIGGVR